MLFRSGNAAEALAPYDQALEEQPRFLACAANRSACHLALGQQREVIRDCTHVLALLRHSEKGARRPTHDPRRVPNHPFASTGIRTDPEWAPVGPVPEPGSERRRLLKLKTLLRRAEALASLSLDAQAATDLRLAHELDPSNEEIAGRLRQVQSGGQARAGGE